MKARFLTARFTTCLAGRVVAAGGVGFKIAPLAGKFTLESDLASITQTLTRKLWAKPDVAACR